MTSAIQRVGGRLITLVVVLAIVIGGLVWYLTRGTGYEVSLIFPAATNLNTGGLVEEQGFTIGHVKHLSTRNGQAIVEITVKGADAPLHTGTTAAIDYKSLLGERYVEITPGPTKNPVVPKYGIIDNSNGDITPRVELQTILNQLTPQVRNQLASLVPQLQEIFQGQSTQNTQATLQSAEPTIDALAKVLEAVGADGSTLHNLVANMADLSTRLVNRQSSLVDTVSGLDQSMNALATQTGNLQTGIQELPSTLQAANTTLAMVPGATTAAVPLLNDLHTATNELPQFSTDLKPVLDVLSPVSQRLVPTLNGLSNLLRYTPTLATTANTVVPQVTTAATKATPTLQTLRPFTKDIVATLTNWGTWLDTFNSTGHLVPVPPVFGDSSLDSLGAVASTINSSATPVVSLLGNQSINANRGPDALPTSTDTGTNVQTDAAGNPIQ